MAGIVNCRMKIPCVLGLQGHLLYRDQLHRPLQKYFRRVTQLVSKVPDNIENCVEDARSTPYKTQQHYDIKTEMAQPWVLQHFLPVTQHSGKYTACYGGPLGPCSLQNCTLPNSTLHTSKFHIAHFQIPHYTLPNSTLHTSKYTTTVRSQSVRMRIAWRSYRTTTAALCYTSQLVIPVLPESCRLRWQRGLWSGPLQQRPRVKRSCTCSCTPLHF